MELSSPPLDILADLASAGSSTSTKPAAHPNLAQLQAALAGNAAHTAAHPAVEQQRMREAQETRQLKEQAYQITPEWHGNSAVVSRTSHGGTEKTLLQKILAQLMLKRQAKKAPSVPRSAAKGPQGPGAQGPQPSMMEQMQGAKTETSATPAAHELPIGE